MHELSIAASIVDTVISEIEKRRLSKVNKIVVNIGALTDIVPDSLQFGFEAITTDTALAETILEIKTIPVSGVCNQCNQTFEVKEYVFICPACSSRDIETKNGNELDIAYLEVDD